MAVILLAHYKITDMGQFLAVFDGFEEVRVRAGATAVGVVRSLDDPTTLVALIEFASRDAAEAFAMSPERMRALRDAGVVGRTDEFLEVIRPFAAV